MPADTRPSGPASYYMNFEQEILRLCEEAVACKSELGGAELARQAQALMHARIEGLRGNLTAMPSLRESCLGLVVGAFLMDGATKVARPAGALQNNHDDLEALRRRLSEAHSEYARSRRSLLQRLLGLVPDVFRRRARPEPPACIRSKSQAIPQLKPPDLPPAA